MAISILLVVVLGGVAAAATDAPPAAVELQPTSGGGAVAAVATTNDATDGAPAAVAPPPGGTVLAYHPFVRRIDNFLTAAECDRVIELAKALPRYNESLPTNSHYFDRTGGRYADPLLQDIERRTAALIGWPDHAMQESLCVHRIAADPASSTRVVNVHHDKANKPYTAVTVVVYLADVEDGGETIFPCDSTRDMQRTCAHAYAQGARWYNGERTVMEGEVHWQGEDRAGEVAGVGDSLALLKERTSELCSQRNRSGFHDRVLAVRPHRGSAIVFQHDKPGGGNTGWVDGDPLAWHTGCKVYKGTKWTLQKFSEIPAVFRRDTPPAPSIRARHGPSPHVVG